VLSLLDLVQQARERLALERPKATNGPKREP